MKSGAGISAIFRIKGISKELRDLFSKRHRQIDEKTRELLACQPEKADRKHCRHSGAYRP